MSRKCFLFWIFIGPLTGYAENFHAERVALKLNLPLFAENGLQNHILDAFPKGAEGRSLLAEAALLQKNFGALHQHLQRLPRNKEYVWLEVLDAWYNEHRLSLIRLLFSPRSHPTARFLRDLNSILYEPIGSVRWACFWRPIYAQQTVQTAESLYQTALEMKFSMFPQFFPPKQQLRVWQSVAASLFARERYTEAKEFLHKALPKLHSATEKGRCLLWLLKTYRSLNENTDALMHRHASLLEHCPSFRDAVVTEWLASISEPTERLRHLQTFYELYKKKHKTLQLQYLQLRTAQQQLELGVLTEARQTLGEDFSRFDPSLRASAYELVAKISLTDTPPSYLKAADCFHEANRCTTDASKRPFYARLESDCLCILGEYQRAYCVCEEAVHTLEPNMSASNLAEAWCTCGILCNETAEEFKEQLIFCRERSLLAEETEQRLKLSFAQHHFEKENFETALRALEPQTFGYLLRDRAYLLQGKCFLRLGAITEAAEALKKISTHTLTNATLGDYYLWETMLEKEQSNFSAAQFYLDRFFELKNLPPDLTAQAVLLQGDLYAGKGEFAKAVQTLKDFSENAPKDWQPFVLFQAADYAEKNNAFEEAVALFEKLYESNPQHSLAKDGRLRQGTLLLNLQKADKAKILLEALLPNLEDEQTLWCRYLIQKCAILSGQPTALSQLQLESMLREELPRALRPEIAMQLAIIYKEQGKLTDLQTLLWSECYPLFSEEPQTFSVNDIHCFSRCLLMLAQHTHDDVTLRRLYELTEEAQLPCAPLIKAYLDDK